ncbi:hypothetical protein ES692_06935 [Psychroserpens burtonensis]|uniref:Uncharacterized protein n=1 Tax=Psychroserpens burtonensis TaxID=49278 RepID=A0A5C7B9T7_9FLAO|nr:hypothetical protein [Psychroserpens burtonensis]TXE18375.1 hypothetical protein ES692_06935 [Psychroserpens burtonensis]
MKALVLYIMMSLLLACNVNKNISKDSVPSDVVSLCPDDGICKFEVLENKKFSLKTDEFGNGYSELVSGDKTVLKFTYDRTTIPHVKDGNYSEIIYIEIENKISSIKLQDKAIGAVKAGFSRICYCKGQTGTFPIKVGSLNLTKLEDDSYQLIFDFTVTEVPQIIKSINEAFILK